MSSIGAKSILVQLSNDDFADPSLKDRVETLAVARGIDSVLITVDAKLMLCSSRTKIFLNSGVSTLQKWLELRSPPKRVTAYFNLPSDFILKYFMNGYDESIIYYSFGDKFTEEFINFIVADNEEKKTSPIHKNQERSRKILAKDIEELVEEGIVSVAEAPRIQNGKDFFEKRKRDRCVNKDLDGAVTLTFQQYARDSADSVAKRHVKTGAFPPVQVTIVGRPAAIEVKEKHYYIYSKLPSFGKSFTLERFAEQYNAHFVNDPSNWTNVPSRTQFLMFDEVDCDHGKLTLSNLKALTGGSTTGFTGNCKSFGDSFTPRKDVQLILLSNESPYDVYGTWNAALQRRVMSTYKMRQFDERFEVFRLDGSVDEDRIKALSPEAWNEDQFLTECRRIVDRMYGGLTNRQSLDDCVMVMEMGVDNIVALCQNRTLGDKLEADGRAFSVFRDFDNGRFWPTLVTTYRTLYQLANKFKGRRLEAAQRKLVRRASSVKGEDFGRMLIEHLARYVTENKTAVYRLYRFYRNVPHCIDFRQNDDKERVFRACLNVHTKSATNEDECMYRLNVFDNVWNVAIQQDEDEENEEGQNTSQKRKHSS